MMLHSFVAMLIVRYGCGKGDLKGKTTTGNFKSSAAIVVTSKIKCLFTTVYNILHVIFLLMV